MKEGRAGSPTVSLRALIDVIEKHETLRADRVSAELRGGVVRKVTGDEQWIQSTINDDARMICEEREEGCRKNK